MATTREQVATAILAPVQASSQIVTVSRRNRDPNSLGPALCPAVMLLEDSEEYVNASVSLPSRRSWRYSLIIYNDIGTDQNAIPTTAINTVLDLIDTLFLATTPTGLCTLGGLVYSAKISGEVKKAPGDRTGKSIAIVPIEVIVP